MDRVRKEFSTRLDAGEHGEFLLDARYDFIRVFPWIKHAVINVVTEEGVARMHVDEATARRVHEKSQIPLVELDWITEQEYNSYLETQATADNLEEWFKD